MAFAPIWNDLISDDAILFRQKLLQRFNNVTSFLSQPEVISLDPVIIANFFGKLFKLSVLEYEMFIIGLIRFTRPKMKHEQSKRHPILSYYNYAITRKKLRYHIQEKKSFKIKHMRVYYRPMVRYIKLYSIGSK